MGSDSIASSGSISSSSAENGGRRHVGTAVVGGVVVVVVKANVDWLVKRNSKQREAAIAAVGAWILRGIVICQDLP